LLFLAATPDGLVYDLDSISIREVGSVFNNDPKDDSRIIFNASTVPQTVDLGTTSFCDLSNQIVSGKVQLGAYESRILLTCFCNHDGVCNNHETSQTCNDDCI
jgi:hypothetical protein